METYAKRISEELSKYADLRTYALSTRDRDSVPGAMALVLFGITTAFRIISGRRGIDRILIGDLATWPIALAARLRSPRAKVVIAAHGTDVSYARRPTMKGKIYGYYLRLAATFFSGALVIANSAATESRVIDAGFRRTRVIPLAADGNNSTPTGKRGNNILFAGRIIPLKGLSWFVTEVLAGLPENIGLDVAGQILDSGEAAVLTHPRVRHLQTLSQDELKAAFAGALAVVVPNISVPTNEFEGFGLVATEAAASGGIVLAADLDGLRDAVIEDRTGFLLTAENADIWIDKIIEISTWSNSRRSEFIRASMEACREWYSWDRVGRQTFDALVGE
jgi:glycosyltransferase involved in cell wall biosynthesis